MMQLKQSTAVNIPFFMVDSTDSITGKTGLSPTVTLSKNGAALGAAGGSVTEVGSGWYNLAANTTDTGTIGPLLLHATATGADPYDEAHQVLLDIPGGAVASVTGAVGSVTGAVGSVTGNVGGNVVGSVASVTGNVGGNVVGTVASVVGNVGGNVVGSVASVVAGVTLAAAAISAIWDKLTSAITTSGSIGKLIVDFLDAAVSSRAPSSTALSTAQWTNGRATSLDNLDATISSRASQSSVNNIQNNTTFAGIVQSPMILPPSGSKVYPFYVRLFDEIGAPIDPDSNIMNYTIKDSSGSVVVATTAMTRSGTGQYTASYTVNSSDTEQALFFFFDYAVNSVAFNQVRSTEVQEFESKLDTLVSRLTAQRALNLDNLDATVSSRLASVSYTAPDNTGIAAIKTKTDNLPASPANEVTVAAVKVKTDNLPASPANEVTSAAIKVKTDQLGFTAGNVNAIANVVGDKTGYTLAPSTLPIRSNTAFDDFTFPMYDAAGLPATGLTVTAKRAIDGAAPANCANAVSEVGLGLYKIDFEATDLNGANIGFKMSATGSLDTIFTVVTQ
jgi:hypothetical protein